MLIIRRLAPRWIGAFVVLGELPVRSGTTKRLHAAVDAGGDKL